MRTTYHGLLAAVSLLLALSRGGLATPDRHHTTTITATLEETRTVVANQVSTSNTTVTVQAAGVSVSTRNTTVTVQAAGVSVIPSNITVTAQAAGVSIPAAITPVPNLMTAPLAATTPQSASQSQLYFTIAVEQGELLNLAEKGPPPGVIRIQPRVAAPQDAGAPPPGAEAAGGPPPLKPGETIDPADGGFLGGSPPNTEVDLPITIVFLVLFVMGAFTHIRIYQVNSKRGHKFLLSDLMFDFCMVRTVTCIFRIIWIFIHPRGIILCAQLFFNGGAAVIFAVNIILTQRIVRSMHPRLGWSKGFSIGTRILALSVPVNIVFQISALIGLFFSVGDQNRLDAFEDMLKVGSSWNLFLVSFPFLAISAACAVPGPRPEKFGVGSLRVKTSMILLAAVMLGTGATVRSYSTFNPRPPTTTDVLYSKAVFYPTQFTLEILVVAMYALLRFDLLFHIPNGSSGPGDYSRATENDPEKASLLTRTEIEERISSCGVPHQILKTSYEKNTTLPGVEQPIYAIFFPSTVVKASAQALEEAMKEGNALQQPKRVSRRQSLLEALERKSERDRKAVGRADRRSVASRRSHWGYAHLNQRNGSSGSSGGSNSGSYDARAQTPPGQAIVPYGEDWAPPEYPRDGRGGYSRPEKDPAVMRAQQAPSSPVMQPRERAATRREAPREAPERPPASTKPARDRVPSVAQVKASRGSGGTPARPPRDLESMYYAGQDAALRPPNPGHRGRH